MCRWLDRHVIYNVGERGERKIRERWRERERNKAIEKERERERERMRETAYQLHSPYFH